MNHQTQLVHRSQGKSKPPQPPQGEGGDICLLAAFVLVPRACMWPNLSTEGRKDGCGRPLCSPCRPAEGCLARLLTLVSEVLCMVQSWSRAASLGELSVTPVSEAAVGQTESKAACTVSPAKAEREDASRARWEGCLGTRHPRGRGSHCQADS